MCDSIHHSIPNATVMTLSKLQDILKIGIFLAKRVALAAARRLSEPSSTLISMYLSLSIKETTIDADIDFLPES